jgi:hypothetical protein
MKERDIENLVRRWFNLKTGWLIRVNI